MRNYRVEGIVLKRINIGEADRIIVLFTKYHGKIKVIGKGIRKLTSKRAPHLEIFSHVVVYLHETKFLPFVTEAQLIHSFGKLRENFRKVAIAYHLCEIVERLFPEKEKNKELYLSFLETLHLLDRESSPVKIRQQVRLFVHNLLLKLGYLPPNQKVTYSLLLSEIEKIIERPLSTLKLLTKIAQEIQ